MLNLETEEITLPLWQYSNKEIYAPYVYSVTTKGDLVIGDAFGDSCWSGGTLYNYAIKNNLITKLLEHGDIGFMKKMNYPTSNKHEIMFSVHSLA